MSGSIHNYLDMHMTCTLWFPHPLLLVPGPQPLFPAFCQASLQSRTFAQTIFIALMSPPSCVSRGPTLHASPVGPLILLQRAQLRCVSSRTRLIFQVLPWPSLCQRELLDFFHRSVPSFPGCTSSALPPSTFLSSCKSTFVSVNPANIIPIKQMCI